MTQKHLLKLQARGVVVFARWQMKGSCTSCFLLQVYSIIYSLTGLLYIGGGSGIGKAVCESLSRKGASVAVADINLSSAQNTVTTLKHISTQSGHEDSLFIAYEVDVSQSDEVKDMMISISRDFAPLPLCGLVNSAGIVSSMSLANTTEEKFDDVIRVNLKVSLSMVQLK